MTQGVDSDIENFYKALDDIGVDSDIVNFYRALDDIGVDSDIENFYRALNDIEIFFIKLWMTQKLTMTYGNFFKALDDKGSLQ